MSTNAAGKLSAAASRWLTRRFSSALSISSNSGPKSFSKEANSLEKTSRPFFASDFKTTTVASSSSLLKFSTSPIHTIANHSSFDSSGCCSSNSNSICSDLVRRSMATSNRKVIDAKNAKRLKIQQKKKKNANVSKAASSNTGENTEDENNQSKNPFLQHQEWVRFQQSITVDGFQTGQTTTATVLKKSRGGKQARRKREKEMARLGAASMTEGGENISAVAQKFPAIRYSPEETEELLKQAYEALPPREGKRGNRNLRRQKLRWKRVRKIRSDYKAHMINAHYDRMEARKYKRDRTKEALESAPEQRQADLDYQGQILQRWMETMDDGKASTKQQSDDLA